MLHARWKKAIRPSCPAVGAGSLGCLCLGCLGCCLGCLGGGAEAPAAEAPAAAGCSRGSPALGASSSSARLLLPALPLGPVRFL